MIIKQATLEDLPALHRLNQSEVPHVGDISADRLGLLYEQVAWFPVADENGAKAGFVICMDQDAAYDSANFLWFRERYERFFYVDRIVVSRDFRRQGLAGTLYDTCIAHAANLKFPLLTLEYNIVPPNPVSAAYHAARGFREVGRRKEAGSSKEVSMQVIDILPMC